MILTENEIASAKAADTAVYLPVRDTKNMLEKKVSTNCRLCCCFLRFPLSLSNSDLFYQTQTLSSNSKYHIQIITY